MFGSYYEFYNSVKIISGDKALDNIPYELGILNVKRPLVITDKGVESAGLIKIFINAFKDAKEEIGAIYSDVPPDSSNRVVNRIAEVFNENNCDSIIAVGGGSPIDTGKGVNILVSEGASDLMDFAGADRLVKPLKPFIVVPTTAGTGSEATSVAVIYNEEEKVKMEFISSYLLPNLAVIDPRMTETMPPKITAATGMDALTHSVEAYTCLQKNPVSDAYAFSAIKFISEYLPRVVENGKDKEARLWMANAATMSGIAFSNSMVGAVHALGHATGAVAKVPHGVAMSIFLTHCLEYNLPKTGEIIGELLLPFSGADEYAKCPAEKRAEKLIEDIRYLQSKLQNISGLPMKLSEAGVEEHQLGDIANLAINDGALMMNPLDMTFDEAMVVLKKAF